MDTNKILIAVGLVLLLLVVVHAHQQSSTTTTSVTTTTYRRPAYYGRPAPSAPAPHYNAYKAQYYH